MTVLSFALNSHNHLIYFNYALKPYYRSVVLVNTKGDLRLCSLVSNKAQSIYRYLYFVFTVVILTTLSLFAKSYKNQINIRPLLLTQNYTFIHK